MYPAYPAGSASHTSNGAFVAFQRRQERRDTASNWTSGNPVLASGELGVEKDTGKFKLGNGVSTWSQLPYFSPGSSSSGTPTMTTYTRDGAYVFVAGDAWQMNQLDAGSGAVWTIPNEITVPYPSGTVLYWRQYGPGVITFVGATGVNIHSRGDVYTSAGQYAEGTVTKVTGNDWVLSGDLAATSDPFTDTFTDTF